VDIYELPGELVVVADMPGLVSNAIDVRFENGTLTIYGKVPDRQREGTRYLWQESGIGDFSRSFPVSEMVDASAIHAEYDQGQLTLHLPKVEAAKSRKIAVKTK
jgi:HSP20 family molecular chaperone IbpA